MTVQNSAAPGNKYQTFQYIFQGELLQWKRIFANLLLARAWVCFQVKWYIIYGLGPVNWTARKNLVLKLQQQQRSVNSRAAFSTKLISETLFSNSFLA